MHNGKRKVSLTNGIGKTGYLHTEGWNWTQKNTKWGVPKPGSIFPDVGLVSSSYLKKILLLTGKQQGTNMRTVQQPTERGLEPRIPHWRTQGSWHPLSLITAPQLEWQGLGRGDWRALWKPSSATLWGMPSRRGRRRALKCIWIWNFERIVLSLKKKE